ncbi:MAG: hypothetical protein AAF333_02890 [Planctomycetota bacterium]
MIDDPFLLSLVQGLSADGRLFTGDTAEVGLEAIRHGSRMQIEDGLVIFGGLLTLVSGLSLVGWLRRQRLRPHALLVFNRAAREAGLTWADRRLLWKVGRTMGLPTPLTLMLCPDTLGYYARQSARRSSSRRGTLDLARAASIRRYLFGPAAAYDG